jgi:Activator of Hsp90 ATPase homolog 1-like protein
MPIYLITNRVPDGFTPSPEAFAAWTAWFGSLGDAVADRGNPAFASTTAGNCGPGTALGGYTLITAADLDAAVGLVAGHPLMTRGGGVEVAELTLINEGTRLRSSGEFSVTASVHVAAPPEEVFRYFTDPARYVRWMGAEARLNPVAGGEYRIRMGDGFEAAGEFTELDPPRRARRPLAALCRPAAPA